MASNQIPAKVNYSHDINNNHIELLQEFMYVFVIYHQESDRWSNPYRDSMDSQALVQQSNGVSAEGYKRVCGEPGKMYLFAFKQAV